MNTELLSQRLWPAAGQSKALRAAVLAVIGSLFVAAAAQISVPMFPVPMTLQTLAVLAVGAAYGGRLGAATLALYALEGAVGLPVFANLSGGAHVVAGPTGGYILGFILAAGLVGTLVEKGWGANSVKLGAAMLLAAGLVYVPGLIWLARFTGAADALNFGLYPFVIGDAVKAVLAALAFPAASSLIGSRSH
jgi:biotin transport system substrate-specific component